MSDRQTQGGGGDATFVDVFGTLVQSVDALAGRSTTAPVAWILVHFPVRDVIWLGLFSLDEAGLWPSHLYADSVQLISGSDENLRE